MGVIHDLSVHVILNSQTKKGKITIFQGKYHTKFEIISNNVFLDMFWISKNLATKVSKVEKLLKNFLNHNPEDKRKSFRWRLRVTNLRQQLGLEFLFFQSISLI